MRATLHRRYFLGDEITDQAKKLWHDIAILDGARFEGVLEHEVRRYQIACAQAGSKSRLGRESEFRPLDG